MEKEHDSISVRHLIELVKKDFLLSLGGILIIVQIIFFPELDVITYIGFGLVILHSILKARSNDPKERNKVYKGLLYGLFIAVVLGLYVYMRFFHDS